MRSESQVMNYIWVEQLNTSRSDGSWVDNRIIDILYTLYSFYREQANIQNRPLVTGRYKNLVWTFGEFLIFMEIFAFWMGEITS